MIGKAIQFHKNKSDKQMEDIFPDIFTKIEGQEQIATKSKSMPAACEFWREIMPGLYQCRITGKKLSKAGFRLYQDQSAGGPLAFVVEVL
jgi:hypothetical protein